MQALAPEYAQRIEEIKAAIQESEELAAYLESEEAEEYNAFKETYEPEIAALHEEAAAYYPLQLEALELALLDPGLEGLFMPKLLGYAVLRPRVAEQTGQYHRPQDHLKQVLLAIAGSNAFTELERRIGQGVTVALALSTNVWVSTVLGEIPNKHPRNFFQSHQDQTLHTAAQRMQLYNRYKRQFATDNYAAAAFPETKADLARDYPALEEFLRTRFSRELDNESLVGPVLDFLANEEFGDTKEYVRFISLACLFVDTPEDYENQLRTQIRQLSKDPAFVRAYFELLAELHHDGEVEITPEVDRRMALRVGVSGDGLMQQYYGLVTTIHDTGIGSLEAQDAIRLFVREQDGGLHNDAATDGNPLALTPGQLVRQVVRPPGDAQFFKDALDCFMAFRRRHAGEHQRHLHVLAGGQSRDQVVGLEYEPDLVATQLRPFVLVQGRGVNLVEEIAPGVGAIQ